MIKNSDAGIIILDLIREIQDNKDFLSEIDGKIGDGDHGINMNKGFTLCQQKLKGRDYSLSEGLSVLGSTLLEDIGGSMGPLYGVFFDELAVQSAAESEITKEVFAIMLRAGAAAIQEIGNAKRGDKTLLDTLIPAIEAYEKALADGKDFKECLVEMRAAAKKGWQSTKDMVAKIGRASRLGDRSKGVLDAGATSCYLIVDRLAQSLEYLME